VLASPAPVSTIQRLTLQRVNLCSLYPITSSKTPRSSSSSSVRVACPLSWIAQHLTSLRSLTLQNVTLERGSLASLTSLESCTRTPWSKPGSLQQLMTPLTSSLQVSVPDRDDPESARPCACGVVWFLHSTSCQHMRV
jgi:hypothetical protein